jgi:glycosyltransferase involved in cell wall biosynthesis
MKIFCHIPREDWFCDRFGGEFARNSRHQVSHTDLGSDIIWILAGWCWKQIPHEALHNTKIVCTIHHEVPQKFIGQRKDDFLLRDQFVDAYHVPCEQTRKFIAQWTKKPIFKLGYWCNSDIWTVKDRKDCKKQFQLPDDALIVGSFQRDTEGSDLKTPKLEKGPDRFCNYVEKIVKTGVNVHVLLNGWRRQYVMNRLDEAGIPFSYHELPSIEDVSKMYSACDLYVVGSRYEGGPQSILECASTLTPIVSTDVGMAGDILPSNCVISMEKEDPLYFPTDEDVVTAYNNVKKFYIENHVPKYDKLFDSVEKL